jgi:hypothetical protein
MIWRSGGLLYGKLRVGMQQKRTTAKDEMRGSLHSATAAVEMTAFVRYVPASNLLPELVEI